MSVDSVKRDDLVTIPAPGPVLTAATLSKFGHEMRGPLSGIIGLTELMSRKIAQDAADSVQQTRHLDMVHASAAELLSTVERTVDLLRLERADNHTGPDTFDCRSVVRRTIAELTDAANARGRRLIEDLPAAPVAALGAVDDAGQAVTELLSNAIKYSDHDDIHVSARAFGGCALIQVRDAGPGLTADDQQAAFEPFRRGSAALTSNEPGSGLGLCLAQHHAIRSGATLSLGTSPQGTTFALTFATQPRPDLPTDAGTSEP